VYILKILNTKKLGTKLLFFSVLTALIPILILGVIATNTVKDSMEVQGQDAIEKDLGISKAMFDEHVMQIVEITEYNTKNHELLTYMEEKDSYKLYNLASNLEESAGLDLVAFTDTQGQVIGSNLNKDVYISDIVKKLSSSGCKYSTEKISDELTNSISNGKISGIEGSLAIISVFPIQDSGSLIGYIVSIDVLNKDYTLVDGVKKSTRDVTTISLGKYRISTNVENNGQRAIGTAISDEIYNQVVLGKQDYYARADVLGVSHLCGYAPLYDCQGNAVGMVFTGTPAAPFDSVVSNILNSIIIIGILGMVIAILISIFTGKKVTKPVDELKKGAEIFGNGNYEHVVKVSTGDELEELANSFNGMAQNIKEMNELMDTDKKELGVTIKDVADTMTAVANGDFTVRADEKRKRNNLQKAINTAIRNVAQLIKDLREEVDLLNVQVQKVEDELKSAEETATQVTEAANQVAEASSDQSAKLQEASDQLENTYEVAKTVYTDAEETVRSAEEISENSENGVKKVENAISRMQGITNVIDDLGKSIQELGEDGKKINEVTDLIKDIAEQTGLLALNASIEAARAGEAGKGFAVVASEIKALAEEIKKSVENINHTIDGVHKRIGETMDLGLKGKDEVDKGVIAIDEVNDALLRIKESVNGAAIKINGIKQGAQSAADNTEGALKNAQDIASISEEFTATAEEVTASTEELNSIIEEIRGIAEEVTHVSERVTRKSGQFKI